MQVHKKKWSVLTSFVSWKSKILFFQIRTLTGFWFCILNWFRSSFNIFSVMLVCVGILHPENNWITDQESCYLKKKKAHVGKQSGTATDMMTSCPAGLCPEEKYLDTICSVLWIPEHCRTFVFSFHKSCYRDWLAVDYSVYLSRFFECLLDLWPYLWIIYAGAVLDSKRAPVKERKNYPLFKKTDIFTKNTQKLN